MDATLLETEALLSVGGVSLGLSCYDESLVKGLLSSPPFCYYIGKYNSLSNESRVFYIGYEWSEDEKLCFDLFFSADEQIRGFSWPRKDSGSQRGSFLKKGALSFVIKPPWILFYDKETDYAVGIGPYRFCSEMLKTALIFACLKAFSSGLALFLHSAGIVIGDYCYLLVGESGSGKTTLARNALEDGLLVLSDDRLVVEREGDVLIAHGTPFGRVSSPVVGPYPVRGVFFLEKFRENETVKMDKKEAFVKIWEDEFRAREGFLEGFFGKELFEQVYGVTHNLPCYRLRFGRDFHDWDLVVEPKG